MMTPKPPARLLNLRLRSDLQWHQSMESDGTRFVASDPLRRDHFTCSEQDFRLLSWIDEESTVEGLCRRFHETYRPQTLSPTTLYEFLNKCIQAGVLRGNNPTTPAIRTSLRNNGKQMMSGLLVRWSSHFVKLIQFQVSLGSPVRLIDFLAPIFLILFHPVCFALLAFGLLVTGVLVTIRSEEFVASLPTWDLLRSPYQLIGYGAIFVMTRAIHELGHAMACRRFGITCRDVGLMFSFGMICPYADITEGWKTKNRTHRMVIALGGIYMELIIATLAVWVWSFTTPGFVHDLSYRTILVCSLSTLLFNANPLMKYDGYFVLSDWLEVNNLRDKSWISFDRLAAGELDSSWARQVGLSFYFVLSLINRMTVGVGLAWLVWQFGYQWQLAGLANGLIILYGCCLAILTYASWVSRPRDHNRQLSWRSVAVGWTGVAIVVVWAVTWKIPSRTWAMGRVVPSESLSVYAHESGMLQGFFLDDGKEVKQGETILRLLNPELERELLSAQSSLQQIQTKVKTTEGAAFYDSSVIDSLPVLESQQRILEKKLEEIQIRHQSLEIRSPMTGRFRTATIERFSNPGHTETQEPMKRGQNDRSNFCRAAFLVSGELVRKDTRIGSIESLSPPSVEVQLGQESISKISLGTPALIRLSVQPRGLFEGFVQSISNTNATDPRDSSHSRERTCVVRVVCDQLKDLPRALGTAEVVFLTPDQSAWDRIVDAILRNVRWR